FSTELDSFRKEAAEFANRAGAKPWTPPVQPEDVLQELATKRSAIQADKTAELKKVDEEYDSWESISLPDRKEIYRNNYVVGKQNAETKANSNRISLEFKMREKADGLRKSMQEEVKRLIIGESRGDQSKR